MVGSGVDEKDLSAYVFSKNRTRFVKLDASSRVQITKAINQPYQTSFSPLTVSFALVE